MPWARDSDILCSPLIKFILIGTGLNFKSYQWNTGAPHALNKENGQSFGNIGKWFHWAANLFLWNQHQKGSWLFTIIICGLALKYILRQDSSHHLVENWVNVWAMLVHWFGPTCIPKIRDHWKSGILHWSCARNRWGIVLYKFSSWCLWWIRGLQSICN